MKFSIIAININRVFNSPLRQKNDCVWFGILIALAIIPAILAILYAPIESDSGYYLSSIERVHDGYMPYKDFQLGYTPLVMYIGLLLKNLFSVGINYEFYLTVHFVFQFLSAFFIYKITSLLSSKKDYAFYAAILFVLLSHWNGGNAFLLETPSIFFGLWAICLAIKYPNEVFVYFFIGIIAALSFLCKQYGLGFLPLVVFLILFNPKMWKQIVCLISGFLIPLIICFLIWGSDFIPVLYGGNYGSDVETVARLRMFFSRLGYLLIRIAPALPVALIYSYPLLKKKSKDAIYVVMLSLGFIGFMLQFLFQSFSHYYLFVFPFISILVFVIYANTNKFKWVLTIFIILTFSLSLYSTYQNRVNKIYIKNSSIKKNQYELSKKILHNIDNNKTLYIADVGLIQQYYLTNHLPPNFKTIGYTFGVALTERTHLEQIMKADYILKFKKIIMTLIYIPLRL